MDNLYLVAEDKILINLVIYVKKLNSLSDGADICCNEFK